MIKKRIRKTASVGALAEYERTERFRLLVERVGVERALEKMGMDLEFSGDMPVLREAHRN